MSDRPTALRWLHRPALAAVVLTACALVGALVLGADGSIRPEAASDQGDRTLSAPSDPPVSVDRPAPPAPSTPAAPSGRSAPAVPPEPPGWGEGGFVFPVDGECVLTDSFGDPRPGNRSHAGVDILADKLLPVRALADGRVRWVMDERRGRCCSVEIEHDDGWRSRYIHLNNDSPGTDDGLVVGVAPGLERGTPVEAGDVIGWVGDSGNAERTVSHLHFELRSPGGGAIDPLPLLSLLEGAC